MTLRIEDYALIGNCTTGALVGCDGSIDWLSLPRFDSPSCFAALLGTAEENGRWLIAPAEKPRRVTRIYRGETMILEARFECDGGTVLLLDFMPLPEGEFPREDLMRIVRCETGSVKMRFEAVFRFDYGSIVPWVRKHPEGLRIVAGPDALVLRSPVALEGKGKTTIGEFTVTEGDTVPFALTWFRSHRDEPRARDPLGALSATEEYWRRWSSQCKTQDEWRGPVIRSLLTLKALTYAPTGGIVAALTTSLPEAIGGVRNWDYRFCWLRDATFTLYAFLLAGYVDEAKAWREWLLRAVAGSPAEIQIMYGLAGERRLLEYELPWLKGYAGSKPVRVGNAAYVQRQLDVYGEVMDAFHTARYHGLEAYDDADRVQAEMLNYLEGHWQLPDTGIWEGRGPERRHTHSAVMIWVALDRSIKSAERFGLGGPVERWRVWRDEVHREICTRGYDSERGVFVQEFGGKALDAALLRVPLVGFLPPEDPRVIRTADAIAQDLRVDGFVLRYRAEEAPDGLPAGEGAFLLCSFWLADNYALMGRTDEACRLYERLLAVRNDVGLLAEEYDPRARRLLGNFPQAFSHVGLINTAHNLTLRKGPAERRAGA